MAFTNNQSARQSQPYYEAPTPSNETSESSQGEVFGNMSHTVATLISRNPSIQHAVEEIANKDHIIDVTAFTALAQSARVHLVQDDRMVLSYSIGNKIYNHKMTAEECQNLNNVLTDESKSNHEKMHGIAAVFSKISIASSAANRFENEASNSLTVRNSIQR